MTQSSSAEFGVGALLVTFRGCEFINAKKACAILDPICRDPSLVAVLGGTILPLS
jgi:hypothetical protein